MGAWAVPLIAALASLLHGLGTALAADAFHKPDTPAERALDALLLRGGDEADMAWFAIGQPSRDRSKDGRFSPLFSKALVAAWRKAEADAVAENCGGRYIKGDICGMDTHPITCAQDRGENGYVFRTDETKGQTVVITARWAGYAEDVAVYRLIHQGGRWVLDGIACAGSPKFNMN